MTGFILSTQGNLETKQQMKRPLFEKRKNILCAFFFCVSKIHHSLSFFFFTHLDLSSNHGTPHLGLHQMLSPLRDPFKCTSLHPPCLYWLEEVEGKAFKRILVVLCNISSHSLLQYCKRSPFCVNVTNSVL